MMKTTIVLCCMVASLSFCFNVYGVSKPASNENTSASSLFAKANQLYQQGKFKEAAQLSAAD
ncbi:hypothetical protein J7M23_03140 [Candidatus Sumerlaeota bacterium]|nr:hypothetical protein [Candidatus Sumerlaeota bacterium]